jgi:hypothetical protein
LVLENRLACSWETLRMGKTVAGLGRQPYNEGMGPCNLGLDLRGLCAGGCT